MTNGAVPARRAVSAARVPRQAAARAPGNAPAPGSAHTAGTVLAAGTGPAAQPVTQAGTEYSPDASPAVLAGVPVRAQRSVLDRLAGDWLAEFGSAETRRAYARELRRFLAWCTAAGVDPLSARRGEVAGYARVLETIRRPAANGPERTQAAAVTGLAPASRARALAAISSFYSYAADAGIMRHNPAVRVRRPKLDRDHSATVALTAREARALLASAATDRYGPPHRAHALVSVLLATGLRIGEAIRANVTDLGYDRGHRILRVVRKGGRPGKVPLPPAALGPLDSYLAARADLPGCRGADGRVEPARAPAGVPLFATATGGRLAQSESWRLIRRLARAASLPGADRLSPHSLRATCATIARANGAELADLQDLLGHADPRTTRRYDKARENLDRSPAYVVATLLGAP